MYERSAVDGDELVTVEPAAEPRQYLTRVDEFEVWSIQTAAEIAQGYEYSHYSGYGRPDAIMLLSLDGTAPEWVTAVIMAHLADEDDYLYTTYELRDAKGNAYGRFTVKIDGRA